jgi:hypothetical protein
MPNHIGLLRENSLHASLKQELAHPQDQIEVCVDSFIVDILHDDEIIEIQTGSFSKLRKKFDILLNSYRIKLVYPVPVKRWIIRHSIESGEVKSRRRSPKTASYYELFNELVYIPELVKRNGFVFEVLGVEDEVHYIQDGRGSWRRKGWSVLDRKLVRIISREVFSDVTEYYKFLPDDMIYPFTIRDLAVKSGLRIRLAQKMAYCFNKMELIERTGKQSKAWLYNLKNERNSLG